MFDVNQFITYQPYCTCKINNDKTFFNIILLTYFFREYKYISSKVKNKINNL